MSEASHNYFWGSNPAIEGKTCKCGFEAFAYQPVCPRCKAKLRRKRTNRPKVITHPSQSGCERCGSTLLPGESYAFLSDDGHASINVCERHKEHTLENHPAHDQCKGFSFTPLEPGFPGISDSVYDDLCIEGKTCYKLACKVYGMFDLRSPSNLVYEVHTPIRNKVHSR